MQRTGNPFLAGLNPQQCEAVRHKDGPLLVLAGAGSGKTRVITCRIAHLLSKRIAKPEEILAVTFTNKAAAEMRERVADLIGKKRAEGLVIATFHAFCLQVLREHIEHLGYRRNFTVSSESDTRILLRRVVDDAGMQDGFDTGRFRTVISLCKNNDETPDAKRPLRTVTDEKYADHIPDIFERYQSALRAANSLDFDDLLQLTLRLWREHPRILQRFRTRFRYVLVDEYQDTNRVQYEVLRLLVGKDPNLCVVGDDDQSIYGWRGADISNILDFERDFPSAKSVTLDRNYRSTKTILAAANAVIANNEHRRAKALRSDLGKGRALDHFVVADEESEAKEAVRWLRHIQGRTGARYRDFALLYRSNVQSRPLEIAFRQAKIPYAVYGGQEFFERAEVKDALSYLKVIVNPRDEAAFLRVVNMPRRGIGDQTLHAVHDLCRAEGLTLGKALHETLQRGLAPSRAATGIRSFLGILTEFRKRFRARGASLAEMTRDLLEELDYLGELERVAKNHEQAFSRWQNVEAVLEALKDYEESEAEATLRGFLDDTHLNTDQDRAAKDDRAKSAVSLMTIHSAKGLEFPYVFLTGIEDGLFPHERSLKENALEEERRLFYVALTRGKRHVSLFEAISRVKHGKERATKPSRFLDEIPGKLVNTHVRAVRSGMEPASPQPKPRKKKPRRRSAKNR